MALRVLSCPVIVIQLLALLGVEVDMASKVDVEAGSLKPQKLFT
jgi:hypothetical protein